jgi:hypothetical protein
MGKRRGNSEGRLTVIGKEGLSGRRMT